LIGKRARVHEKKIVKTLSSQCKCAQASNDGNQHDIGDKSVVLTDDEW